MVFQRHVNVLANWVNNSLPENTGIIAPSFRLLPGKIEFRQLESLLYTRYQYRFLYRVLNVQELPTVFRVMVIFNGT